MIERFPPDQWRDGVEYQLEDTADWRRMTAVQYPQDGMNLDAALLCEKLAAEIPSVDGILWEALSNLDPEEVANRGLEISEAYREIGFRSFPDSATEFVESLLSMLSPRRMPVYPPTIRQSSSAP